MSMDNLLTGYELIARAEVATAHKNFSPVVNLGITGSKEQVEEYRIANLTLSLAHGSLMSEYCNQLQ